MSGPVLRSVLTDSVHLLIVVILTALFHMVILLVASSFGFGQKTDITSAIL